MYHYTPLTNLKSILRDGLKPSTGDNAIYGEGQYLTDISASEASQHSETALADALYNDPTHWGDSEIGYLELQFDRDDVRRVHDVYNPLFVGKGIFLHHSFVPYIFATGSLISFGEVIFSGPM